jgi:hypothetical protein
MVSLYTGSSSGSLNNARNDPSSFNTASSIGSLYVRLEMKNQRAILVSPL